MGLAGQANYGYANAAVDMLALCRKEAGLPALAIQWGPIADVGFVAEIMKVEKPLTLSCCRGYFPSRIVNPARITGVCMLLLGLSQCCLVCLRVPLFTTAPMPAIE